MIFGTFKTSNHATFTCFSDSLLSAAKKTTKIRRRRFGKSAISFSWTPSWTFDSPTTTNHPNHLWYLVLNLGTKPRDQGTKPRDLGIKPRDPGTKPRDPGTKPRYPGTKLRYPGTKPRYPGTKPRYPVIKPRLPGTTSGSKEQSLGNQQVHHLVAKGLNLYQTEVTRDLL